MRLRPLFIRFVRCGFSNAYKSFLPCEYLVYEALANLTARKYFIQIRKSCPVCIIVFKVEALCSIISLFLCGQVSKNSVP